jgi:hypothetical protein
MVQGNQALLGKRQAMAPSQWNGVFVAIPQFQGLKGKTQAMRIAG